MSNKSNTSNVVTPSLGFVCAINALTILGLVVLAPVLKDWVEERQASQDAYCIKEENSHGVGNVEGCDIY